jgi:D-aminopeptidase
MLLWVLLTVLAAGSVLSSERPRVREFGIKTGILPTGPLNSITDVGEVAVGQVTLVQDENIRTGVTVILLHRENPYLNKVPAGIDIANGFGKLMGYTQVEELGCIETPIVLTNTLSVATAASAVIEYILSLPGNENVLSVNPVVGETNDGELNDIRGRHIKESHVRQAIHNASGGPVEEGSVGAGTGTICFGYKGGIGTSSRKLPDSLGGYSVGVLVQTNFRGILQIAGLPVGLHLKKFAFQKHLEETSEGSCMMVVATDAPLDSRNCRRLAKRALPGIPRTGGYYSNGSGDYAIAFTTDKRLYIPHDPDNKRRTVEILENNAMSPLFLAAAEAAEEAILNSMFKSETMTGWKGNTAPALPLDEIRRILEKK